MIILRYMNSAESWEIKPRLKLSLLNKNNFFSGNFEHHTQSHLQRQKMTGLSQNTVWKGL